MDGPIRTQLGLREESEVRHTVLRLVSSIPLARYFHGSSLGAVLMATLPMLVLSLWFESVWLLMFPVSAGALVLCLRWLNRGVLQGATPAPSYKPFKTRLGFARHLNPRSPTDGHPRIYGGQMTGHPVGLLVVAGVVWIALMKMPEARVFMLVSLALGALVGLVLWLKHK